MTAKGEVGAALLLAGLAGSGAGRLEPVKKVVTLSDAWGLKSCVQAGSSVPWRCASGRKITGRMVHVMRVLSWATETVQGSLRRRACRVAMRPW